MAKRPVFETAGMDGEDGAGYLPPDALSENGSLYRPPQCLSNEELFREAARTLPIGIELLKPLHYRIALERGDFDFLVLKLAVPGHKEPALRRWREDFEDRHRIRVLIDRSSAFSGAGQQLRRWTGGGDLLTSVQLPRLGRYLRGVFGKPPSACRETEPPTPLVDLTGLDFVAIDAADTRGREDVLYAEAADRPGHVRLVAGFIDVTPFMRPGSYADRYAERIGSTVFASHNCIPTLGPELAFSAASFLKGERRAAWVVDMEIDPLGELARCDVLHAAVVCREYIAPQDVNRQLENGANCPLNLHYLQAAVSRLHTRRMKQKKIIMVSGDGLGGVIVGESMLAAKSAIARFMISKNLPAVFKVHVPPTAARKEEFVKQVLACGVPVQAGDFDDPLQFAGVLQALEQRRGNPRAHQTLQEIMDVFLTRSRFDTVNRGHFGIGADAYLEIKPRDAAGLPNQYQLLHYFDSSSPALSAAELEHRAARRNRQIQERGTVDYKLRFFERLRENLSMQGCEFTGTVKEILKERLLVEVPGFTRWGVVPLPPRSNRSRFKIGHERRVRLQGFSIDHMRFLFSMMR